MFRSIRQEIAIKVLKIKSYINKRIDHCIHHLTDISVILAPKIIIIIIIKYISNYRLPVTRWVKLSLNFELLVPK